MCVKTGEIRTSLNLSNVFSYAFHCLWCTDEQKQSLLVSSHFWTRNPCQNLTFSTSYPAIFFFFWVNYLLILLLGLSCHIIRSYKPCFLIVFQCICHFDFFDNDTFVYFQNTVMLSHPYSPSSYIVYLKRKPPPYFHFLVKLSIISYWVAQEKKSKNWR